MSFCQDSPARIVYFGANPCSLGFAPFSYTFADTTCQSSSPFAGMRTKATVNPAHKVTQPSTGMSQKANKWKLEKERKSSWNREKQSRYGTKKSLRHRHNETFSAQLPKVMRRTFFRFQPNDFPFGCKRLHDIQKNLHKNTEKWINILFFRISDLL